MAIYSNNQATLLLVCLICLELQTVSALPEGFFKRDTPCETLFCPGNLDILAPLLRTWPLGGPQLPNAPPPQAQPVPDETFPAPDVNPEAPDSRSPAPSSGQAPSKAPLIDPQIEILKIESDPETQNCQAIASSNNPDSQSGQVSREIQMRTCCCIDCRTLTCNYRGMQIHLAAKKPRSGSFSL